MGLAFRNGSLCRGPMEQQKITDAMDPARATALAETLGMTASGALPPFWHWIYFWDAQAPSALGPDGHPAVGQGLIPDLGLPRRMWAGGRIWFDAPLCTGTPAMRTTTRLRADHKQGRSGALGLVTLHHEIAQGGKVCIREEQDLVYREPADPNAPQPAPPTARTDAQTTREVAFNPTLLFRYSALTFNGHRIHYDLPYAREIEGYAGLVVHGPLLAQLLMQVATDELGLLKSFQFRATSALMDFETATLCRNGQDLWVMGPDGRQCMTGTATV